MERKIDRLDKYMKVKGLNDNRITISCGLSNGVIGKSREKGRDLSNKTIAVLLKVYDDLNEVWLLTGNGEMLKNAVNQCNVDGDNIQGQHITVNKGRNIRSNNNSVPEINEFKTELEKANLKIMYLEKIIKDKADMITFLKNIIENGK
jgi:hypothetical protein